MDEQVSAPPPSSSKRQLNDDESSVTEGEETCLPTSTKRNKLTHDNRCDILDDIVVDDNNSTTTTSTSNPAVIDLLDICDTPSKSLIVSPTTIQDDEPQPPWMMEPLTTNNNQTNVNQTVVDICDNGGINTNTNTITTPHQQPPPQQFEVSPIPSSETSSEDDISSCDPSPDPSNPFDSSPSKGKYVPRYDLVPVKSNLRKQSESGQKRNVKFHEVTIFYFKRAQVSL